jgi:hypothetical protein
VQVRYCGFDYGWQTPFSLDRNGFNGNDPNFPSPVRNKDNSGNIQGTFREHSGNIQGACREYSGNIQAASPVRNEDNKSV